MNRRIAPWHGVSSSGGEDITPAPAVKGENRPASHSGLPRGLASEASTATRAPKSVS